MNQVGKHQKILSFLDRLIEIFLILLIITIPFSFHAHSIETICFIAIVLIFIIRFNLDRKERYIQGTSIDLPILIFTGLIIISIFFSVSPLYSLHALQKYWLKPVFLFYVVVNFADKEKKFRNLTWAVLISSLIPIGIGILNFFSLEYLFGHKRLESIITGPVEFAEYLELFVPILLAFCFWGREKYIKVLSGLLLAANLFCLLFTYSRGSWIAVFFVVSFLCFKKNKWLILLPLLLAVILFSVSMPKLKQRILSMVNIEKLLDKQEKGRISVWVDSINQIKEKPLTGFGWGWKNFRKLSEQFIPEKPTWHAHNYFLEIAFESGVPAFCVFLWLWITIIVKSWKTHISLKDQFLKTLAIAVFGAFLVKFIHWLVEVPINEEQILTIWVFVGISMALENFVKNNAGVLKNEN